MTDKSTKNIRSQAAMELIIVYGLALLIIVLVVGILFTLFSSPPTATQNLCNFGSGVTCVDTVIGASNVLDTNTVIIVFLTNAQPYSLSNAILFSSLGNVNTTPTTCLPSIIKQGGAIICELNISEQSTPNEFISGNLYLSASYCGLSTNSICANPVQQTYVGQFSGHAESYSKLIFSLSLSATSNTIETNNQKDNITATLKLFGQPIKGATLNFSDNSINYHLAPLQIDTDANGEAQTNIWGNHTGYANVIVTFGSISNSVVIHFT